MGLTRRTFLLAPLALAAAERKPNLVLIIARGWRGLATPWARDPDLAAPNLEKFAGDGVVFPRAYSCYPSPIPSRAALATGRYPHLASATNSAPVLQTIILTLPAPTRTYDPAALHPRQNIPSNAEPKARQDLSKYYAALSALDDELARQFEALSGDTIVAFTSDCGQQIGSHGLEGDDSFYEESVRVPLAIRYPGVLPRGLASDLIVSQVDILPTLLGLSGEPLPEGVQGRDLSPLLTGKQGERPESVYVEGKIGQSDEWRMLVLGVDKLVVNSKSEVTHLYNLAEDPYELTNLARDPTVKLKRDGLLAQLRASGRHFADFKKRS